MKLSGHRRPPAVLKVLFAALLGLPLLPPQVFPVDLSEPVEANSLLPKSLRNPKDGAEMLLVPEGTYRAENIHLDKPVMRRLGSYYIYKYLVTVSQFRKFCGETQRTMPPQPDRGPRKGFNKLFPERWFQGDAFAPVVDVTWDDAEAYCKWAAVALPTDGQWEMAAWGAQDWRKLPRSPFGVEELIVPLRQWCEFNEEDREAASKLLPAGKASLRSIRGTYGPFDPFPDEHSSLTTGNHGQSFRGARSVRLQGAWSDGVTAVAGHPITPFQITSR